MNAFFNTYKTAVIVGVFAILVALGAGGWYLATQTDALDGMTGKKSVAILAEEAVAACADAPVTQVCYEENVPELLGKYSMDTVFDVIREIRNRDNSYQYCHVLAHEVGERETEKDPERWMDVLTECPTDGLCSNGCMHGASVSRFSNEILNSHQLQLAIEDLKVACEPRDGWNPSDLDSAICYHGLGHLAVHMTAANIPRALDVCDAVAEGDEHKDRLCDEGVYMQLFQPLEPEDFALIDQLPEAPTRENIETFCAEHGEQDERAACWREGWPTHREELRTAEGIVNFCSNGPAYNDENRCYTTVLTINARFSLNEPERMASLCSGIPEPHRTQCFQIGATAIIEERRTDYNASISFCERAARADVRDRCYERLADYVTFVYNPSSPEARAFCAHMPAKWQSQCASQLPTEE